MNLVELTTAVYDLTKRPDMVAETSIFIKSSTLELHLMGKFLRDIQRAKLTFTSSAYIQVYDTSVIDRYRQSVYMMPSDSYQTITTDLIPACLDDQSAPLPPLAWGYADMDYTGLIQPVEADDIFDVQGFRKTNIMYQAGSNLYINSAASIQYAQFAWLAYPDVGDNTYSSWIADQYPYGIIFKATSRILAHIGKQDMARTYDNDDPENPGLSTQWIRLIQQNNTVA